MSQNTLMSARAVSSNRVCQATLAQALMSELHQELIYSWLCFCRELKWETGNLDASSWTAALRAASLHIDAQAAYNGIAERIIQSGGDLKSEKVASQVRRAREYVLAGKALPSNKFGVQNAQSVRVRCPEFDPRKLRRLAARVKGVDARWLSKRSARDPNRITPADFLNALYRQGEYVRVFVNQASQGHGFVRCQREWQDPDDLNWFIRGHEKGVWFLVQPVDGAAHSNPRQGGKLSFRSEEAVVAWRYLVAECDEVDPRHFLAALVQLPLRIAAIYSSGGRGYHALIRVDAQDKLHWDRVRDRLKPELVAIGADPHALSAVRLSRLPGCWREETGREQRLLYLNPKPAETPITDLV